MAQKEANLAELFRGKKLSDGLSDREIDKIVEVYDTSVETVEEDIQRFSALGYTSDFL